MSTAQCPVCTLYLREGMSMKEHLDTHTKDRVIEALVSSEKRVSSLSSQSHMVPYQTFIQTPYQVPHNPMNLMQHYSVQNTSAPIQTNSTSYVTETSEKNVAVYNAPINYSPQTIISQPGTIIKIPPRPQNTKIIAVPVCNQFVGAPHFAPPLMQMPLRGAMNNSLMSNPSIQNQNSQGLSAVMSCYSQVPSNGQPPMHSTQTFTSQYHSDANVLSSQSTLNVPETNLTNSSFSVPSQENNNTVESTSVALAQTSQVSTETIEKDNSSLRVSTQEETRNVSTQSAPVCNNIDYPDEIEEDSYEEIKGENGFRSVEEEEFEFFQETELFETEQVQDNLNNVKFQSNKPKISNFKQNSSQLIQTNVELSSEKVPSKNSTSSLVINEKEKNISSSSEIKNDKVSQVKDELDDLSNTILDESSNTSTKDLVECESPYDDETNLIAGDMGYEEDDLGPSSPLINDYETSPGEDGVCLESPIKLEGDLEADLDLDLSHSPFSDNSGDDSTNDDYFNASLISNSIVDLRSELFKKENLDKLVEPVIPTSNGNEILQSEKKRKINVTDIVEDSPCTKKTKQLIPTTETDKKDLNLPSYDIEGNIPYDIKEVVFHILSFNNTQLNVHALTVPDLVCNNVDDKKQASEQTINNILPKNEDLEQLVESKPIAKYLSDTNDRVREAVSFKPVDYESQKYTNISQFQSQTSRHKNVILTNSKSQTNKRSSRATPVSTPLLTVIQQPLKTEPPPPYHAKIEPSNTPDNNSYTTSHFLQPNSFRNDDFGCQSSSLENGKNKRTQHTFPGRGGAPSVALSLEFNSKQNVSVESKPSHSAILPDYPICNSRTDRQNSLLHLDYDSDDAAPRWLFRGINALPTAIEDDRISCASPKTLLNLDHQTSFQTFGPDDSRSTSLNMHTDEMMPPRGELSGQESLESSAWGYQEDNGSNNFRQWEESEPDVVFKIKTEKVDHIPKIGPIDVKSEKIKTEDELIVPVSEDSRKKHACIYCNKVFVGWKLRKYHMKTEHPELFNEPESTSKLIEKVQSGSHNEASSSVVSCSSCPMKFDNSALYGAHFQQVHAPVIGPLSLKSKQRQCSTCLETFDKLKPFQDHIRFVHPLECPVCNKTFLTKPNLTIHMRTHLKIKPYKCDKCEKSFVTAQKLSDHKNTHTGNAPFPCNLCERNFKRYSNLAQHKKVIHLKKKKTKDFYCHCGEIFQSKGKLLWHQETHANVPKQCSFCVEKFTHTSSLTRHIRKNHDPCYLPDDRKEDENVSCEICKIVVLKSTLKSHMRIHATSKPFSCTVCKKSFYTKWNLGLHQWTHVSRTHMPFKCKSCNRGFYNAGEYQAHLRSHRNIRPYTCNYCGRKFIRKFNCIRHVREHEAKKKYTCTICNKSFHRSYYLTAHERVHNGERPFSCHICGKASTTKSNHNKHVKTHHARENVNTEG